MMEKNACYLMSNVLSYSLHRLENVRVSAIATASNSIFTFSHFHDVPQLPHSAFHFPEQSWLTWSNTDC